MMTLFSTHTNVSQKFAMAYGTSEEEIQKRLE